MATVHIPTPLRRLTGGQARVQVDGANILAILEALDSQYPGFRERLFDDGGELKRFINIYVNDEEIRTLAGKATAVKEGDRITIVPAMAGG